MAKKTTSKKRKPKADGEAAPPDLRAPLPATPENLTATLAAARSSLDGVDRPAEPRLGDLVDAMLHITMGEGLPCSVGQECVRRFAEHFVDRNELRLTEAYEIEDLVGDLEIPGCFARAQRAREAIAEIYNDQNDVTLEFLRELSITDRKLFFQRVPALKPVVTAFLISVITFEEVLLTDRSTLRVQQRLGIDKEPVANEFFAELRQLVQPFGHLPLSVGPAAASAADGALCVACSVARLVPSGKS
ncbi:MAG: hypothetical protein H6837_17900 [Planctomycetes bacterium]|nr:hypothetical protein [Planctomycetota bacterium]